jgi:hypothetical protein
MGKHLLADYLLRQLPLGCLAHAGRKFFDLHAAN